METLRENGLSRPAREGLPDRAAANDFLLYVEISLLTQLTPLLLSSGWGRSWTVRF